MSHGSDELPPILLFAHAVLCGRSVDECERAFAGLCKEDLEAAIHLADLLAIALPHTAPLWRAIIDHYSQEPAATDVDRLSGLAMSDNDTRDTAGGLAAHMGWRDVEAGA